MYRQTELEIVQKRHHCKCMFCLFAICVTENCVLTSAVLRRGVCTTRKCLTVQCNALMRYAMCGDRLYRVCVASAKSEYKHRAEKNCIEKVYNETAQIECTECVIRVCVATGLHTQRVPWCYILYEVCCYMLVVLTDYNCFASTGAFKNWARHAGNYGK